jgi:hypothetical protein
MNKKIICQSESGLIKWMFCTESSKLSIYQVINGMDLLYRELDISSMIGDGIVDSICCNYRGTVISLKIINAVVNTYRGEDIVPVSFMMYVIENGLIKLETMNLYPKYQEDGLNFGQSYSISGDVDSFDNPPMLFVSGTGKINDDSTPNPNSTGGVYVFKFNGTTFTQGQLIRPPKGTKVIEEFGKTIKTNQYKEIYIGDADGNKYKYLIYTDGCMLVGEEKFNLFGNIPNKINNVLKALF